MTGTDSAGVVRGQLDLFTKEQNFSALRTTPAPHWVSSQNYRSTSDILWSCLLTMTACIYTALHLNIAAGNAKKRSIFDKFKVKWVITALFAPELVLYLACSQYLEARWLYEGVAEITDQERSLKEGCK
ncbi:hypothetical protein PG985_002713 [Apiospora marii]|uniref:uncharacterized protein n=1 Tax=Apiospora marii TaxID=335849 RepID=UPI00312F2F00